MAPTSGKRARHTRHARHIRHTRQRREPSNSSQFSRSQDAESPRHDTSHHLLAKNKRNEKTCRVCRQIIDFLSHLSQPGPSRPESITLGSYAELISDSESCTQHSYFLRSLFGLKPDRSAEVHLFVSSQARPTFPVIAIRPLPDNSRLIDFSPSIALLPRTAKPYLSGHGMLVNETWIDLRLVKRWQQECRTDHKECQSWLSEIDISGQRPHWLMDLWRQCLVPAPDGVEYVTLSYVWGQMRHFSTTTQNVDELCKPGAFAPLKACKIPRTISDAMSLSERLGFRYFWVDSLCILQDAHDFKHSEIKKMGSIYANSALTIIAANGADADTGLHGLRGISKPRHYSQATYKLGGHRRVVGLPPGPTEEDPGWSTTHTWESRGWTVQEKIFSRRKLIFYDGLVCWQCGHGRKYEDFHGNMTGAVRSVLFDYPKDRGVDFSTPVPILADLGLLVASLNAKQLTFPEDILDSFSGIASLLSKNYAGGLISGLPSMFFNIALLWQAENVTRRQPHACSKEDACLPSWSWCGWKGRLWWCSWILPTQSVRKCTGTSTEVFAEIWQNSVTSSLQWYRHDTPQSPGVAIDFSHATSRDKFADNTTATLPRGWSRLPTRELLAGQRHCETCKILAGDDWESCPHEAHVLVDWKPAHAPKCLYTHESNPARIFLFPQPEPGSQETPELLHTKYVSCHTGRCWFNLAERFETGKLLNYPAVSIRDDNGNWVGALNVQVEADSLPVQARRPVELIELAEGKMLPSGGFAEDILFEWKHEECPVPRDGKLYEFYYVMWITWENGIAYRQGIGRVMRAAWEDVQCRVFLCL
ncbi:heterokaryon incompatibility protein-domain-containing protein [Xylariomycetidae sp. FL0641]|nr:heterokaryon incompatibility protein-domain-containing protein [Xylariomycetidae sp. FL0641]